MCCKNNILFNSSSGYFIACRYAYNAAPIAPKYCASGSTAISMSKLSDNALRTAPFFATPPDMHTIGVTPALLASADTRAATLLQIPAIRSSRYTPFASWLMTSDSANTVQVLEIEAGLLDFAAQASKSPMSI